MNQNAINQAIAQAIGLDRFVGLQKRGYWWRPGDAGYTAHESEAGRYTMQKAKERERVRGDDDDVIICKFTPPNFCGSLDACAQFEAQLEPNNKDTAYLLILMEVCGVEFDDRADYGYIFALTTATAPQRCEAFLRLKGEWK